MFSLIKNRIPDRCPECGASLLEPSDNPSFPEQDDSVPEKKKGAEDDAWWVYKLFRAILNAILYVPLFFLFTLLIILFDPPLEHTCEECGYVCKSD